MFTATWNIKAQWEQCGFLVIYLFDRPEQPTEDIFKRLTSRQLERWGFQHYLSFFPWLPDVPACSLMKMLIQSRAGSGPPATQGVPPSSMQAVISLWL